VPSSLLNEAISTCNDRVQASDIVVLYCEMTPESRNSSLPENGSLTAFP
jgi:hypothetical protein